MSSWYPPADFTAWSCCPECGTVACHPFAPAPAVDEDPDLPAGQDWYQAPSGTLIPWAGAPVILQSGRRLWRADQTTCSVVRSCTNCHAEWPER